MKICAVICELNPCHRGHEALFTAARHAGATHVAAILSGDFVQRGTPSLLPKWDRTRQALLSGADLVVELPLPWAMAGAERFARGGVSLARELGAEALAFGTECGTAEPLERIAEALLTPEFGPLVRDALTEGVSFAAARQAAVASLLGPAAAAHLASPNNALAVEYLKAARSLGTRLRPVTIKRLGAGHDSLEESAYPSGSRIREEILSGGDHSSMMPPAAAAVLEEALREGRAPATLEQAERAVLYTLRRMELEELRTLPEISEGLENRIYAASRRAGSLEELYTLIKTKRYPLGRIRRVVTAAFLGLRSEDGAGLPPYVRVLGLDERGREMLSAVKTATKRPILTHSSDSFSLDSEGRRVVELEHLASDLYALCMPSPRPCGSDLTHGMVMLEAHHYERL